MDHCVNLPKKSLFMLNNIKMGDNLDGLDYFYKIKVE